MKQQKVQVLSTNKVVIYVVCATFSFMAGGLLIGVAQAVRPNSSFLPVFLTMGLGLSSLFAVLKRNVNDWLPWTFVATVFLVCGIAYHGLAGTIGAIAALCFTAAMAHAVQPFNKAQIMLNALCFLLGFAVFFLR